MLIDTHAHLDMKDFDRDRQATLDRAVEGGITHIVTIGTDLSSSLKALELAHTYDFVYASVGYHLLQISRWRHLNSRWGWLWIWIYPSSFTTEKPTRNYLKS